MALLASLSVFMFIALAVYGLLWQRQDQVSRRLSALRVANRPESDERHPEESFRARVLDPLLGGLGDKLDKLLPQSTMRKIKHDLALAGSPMGAGQMVLLYGGSTVAMPIAIVAMIATVKGLTATSALFLTLSCAFVGAMLPRLWLKSRIRNRQRMIMRSLPDAIDLVTASVEAGLGIDGALAKVVEKMHGPFADELHRTMREIAVGRLRRDALEDLAKRTGVDELNGFVAAIIQAESMGVSIGRVMRIHSEQMRVKRRQRAEEQAYKAPIKLVFPLVFFIFPAIFVIIGGPAAITIMESIGGG